MLKKRLPLLDSVKSDVISLFQNLEKLHTMKKNITINLFGTLYAIDEDACQLLETYLNNMKNYFSRRDGGDEIADDIEHRVAELFSELREKGVEAVTIEHVRDIISRIGNPEQMDNETDDSPADASAPESEGTSANADAAADNATVRKNKKGFFSRKLYRDPDDKMIAGVMSGLCHYFGANDPLPWRILLVILAIFSFMTVSVVYLALWAIVPEAVTPEERLQLHGQPVNPTTLNEEIMRAADKAQQFVNSPRVQNSARSFFGTLGQILLFCIKLLLLLILIPLAIGGIIFTIFLIIGTFVGWNVLVSSGAVNEFFQNALLANPAIELYFWLACIAGWIAICLLLFGLLRSLLVKSPERRLSVASRVTLIIAFVLSFATSITFLVIAGGQIEHFRQEKVQSENLDIASFLSARSSGELDNWGLELLELRNVSDDGDVFHWEESIFTGEDVPVLELERDMRRYAMIAKGQKQVDLPAGDYHIEAIYKLEGKGASLFFDSADGSALVYSMTSRGYDGKGNMASLSPDELEKVYAFRNESRPLSRSSEVRERLEEWDFQRTPSFHHAGGTLTFGFTTLPEATGNVAGRSGVSDLEFYSLEIVSDGPGADAGMVVDTVVVNEPAKPAASAAKAGGNGAKAAGNGAKSGVKNAKSAVKTTKATTKTTGVTTKTTKSETPSSASADKATQSGEKAATSADKAATFGDKAVSSAAPAKSE